MTTVIREFVLDEEGVTAIEYVLIASLISIAIIAGAAALGTSLNSTFQSIAAALSGPSS
jgi:pilus assembly protein Flp/PilA